MLSTMPAEEALAHVYCLGGSACAGKTSVARLLAERHGLALYSCDDHFEEHRRRADPERHPRFCRIAALAPEELWTAPAEVQAEDLLGFYEDEMEMVFEDLADIDEPVLAEGVGLLPQRVSEVLTDTFQTVWLISTPKFRQRAYVSRRNLVEELIARYPNPERTFAGWMERDSLIAHRIAEEARRIGGAVARVDGRSTVEDIATAVADLLGLG
jgi:hypothetical protein